MPPLVTCLCLTKNRREWLPKAIECFQRQTYPRRELLILASGEESVTDLVPRDDPRIRLMIIGWTLNIGALRNTGCDCARGEIIAHWDDDDYSAPPRLAGHVKRLQESEKAVTGYHTMKFTNGAAWWQYRGSAGFVLGTSLCYRRDWWKAHNFVDMQVGEDSAFVASAVQEQQLAAEGDLDLMYATIHPGNTSPRPLAVQHLWVPLPGYEWKEVA